MYEAARTLIVHAIEPIHVGAAAGAGGVDLPVARDARRGEHERGDPILTFSALRGAFRDVCPEDLRPLLLGEGPSGDSNEGARGALTFTDALPLLFPVRSVKGGFAWATCPRILGEFGRRTVANPPEVAAANAVVIAPGAVIALRQEDAPPFVVIAGERYMTEEEGTICDWLHRRLGGASPGAVPLAARLAVVPDAAFARLVARETERRQRVRIDRTTGTVAGQALFSVEALPRDTVLFGSILALAPGLFGSSSSTSGSDAKPPRSAGETLERAAAVLARRGELTIGGDVTVGMGRCQVRLI